MGCKYVKDFSFDSAAGYSGSAGKKEVKTYLRGGPVNKAPLDASVPRQTPTNMRPLRTANAKTAMKESTQKNVSGASGKVSTAGQYAKGGMACASGCKVEMKKGGKTKKAAPRKSAAKSKSKAEDKMIEQLLEQMVAQTAQTGRVPGVPMGDMMQEPMMQGRPMPAPNARAVPVASQSPLIAMMHGGKARK